MFSCVHFLVGALEPVFRYLLNGKVRLNVKTRWLVSLILLAFLYISAELNKLTKSTKSTNPNYPLRNYSLLSSPGPLPVSEAADASHLWCRHILESCTGRLALDDARTRPASNSQQHPFFSQLCLSKKCMADHDGRTQSGCQ